MRITTLSASLALVASVAAGPCAYGICQTGCAAVVVACYAAAGFTFGTVAAPMAPPAIIACNSAYGTCQAACAAAVATLQEIIQENIQESFQVVFQEVFRWIFQGIFQEIF
ncbi:hypothetical protein IWZ01DRAFT_541846 [Phyllosticta capitalensis]